MTIASETPDNGNSIQQQVKDIGDVFSTLTNIAVSMEREKVLTVDKSKLYRILYEEKRKKFQPNHQ